MGMRIGQAKRKIDLKADNLREETVQEKASVWDDSKVVQRSTETQVSLVYQYVSLGEWSV